MPSAQERMRMVNVRSDGTVVASVRHAYASWSLWNGAESNRPERCTFWAFTGTEKWEEGGGPGGGNWGLWSRPLVVFRIHPRSW
jgi:hypothetical protein